MGSLVSEGETQIGRQVNHPQCITVTEGTKMECGHVECLRVRVYVVLPSSGYRKKPDIQNDQEQGRTGRRLRQE